MCLQDLTTKIQLTILLLAVSFLSQPRHADASPAIGQQPRTTTEFTPTQFHIQTDTGDNRFFKYQTWNGSFRKEVTLDDGSVAGSYGWVDANGILRVTEYVSDDKGYRITKTETYNVGKQTTPAPGTGAAVPGPTTPLPSPPEPQQPIQPVQPVQPAKPPQHEESNEISDDQTFFVPVLRPYSGPLPVARNPFFVLTGVPSAPQPFFAKSPIVRQLPLRKRRRLGASTFGARTNGIQPVFDEIQGRSAGSKVQGPIDNKDDFLFFPERQAKRARFEAADQVPLRRRLLKNGRVFARVPNAIGGRALVVKRRRNKSPIHGDKMSINYQTDKTFHTEVEAEDGERHGEYGYIDPLGVRRVVTYTTGARGSSGITKQKENDYVGPNTYFDSN